MIGPIQRKDMPLRSWCLAAIATVILSGCIGGSSNCEALPNRIELSLSADATLAPSNPAVCRDDEVALVVTPDIDGIFHIHGYDEQVAATEMTAGEVTEFEFIATRSGQFPIELHTDDNTEGVNVGIFTVHEP